MKEQTRLIVVSGLSGSGKSVALNVLEDVGYYCIDNMPAALIKSLLTEIQRPDDETGKHIAIGVDVRNRKRDLEALPGLIKELRQSGVQADILFLQATDDILLKRYSESRRRHPLVVQGGALRAAIESERVLLGEIINAADLVIDTSRTSVYELGDAIRERVDRRKSNDLSVLIESFGFKHGIPADADFVFDLRCLPNPYWVTELRALTGQDQAVIDFLNTQPDFQDMFKDIRDFFARWIPNYISFNRSYLTVAIGCTGGQHRSVCMADKLAEELRKIHDPVITRHNEIGAGTSSELAE